MEINFDDVNLLENAVVNPGDRWIFTADLNISGLERTARLDSEFEDLEHLLRKDAKVIIVGHRGRHEAGKKPDDVSFVVPYLSQKLGRDARYSGGESLREQLSFAKDMKPGEAVVMRNIRAWPEEEKNDAMFSRQLARLGNCVAVGGFSKSHRRNASNYGVLEYLPGFLARSQANEMEFLSPWAGRNEEEYSVVVLGGVKGEKINPGLTGFAGRADYIILGGIGLNTLLHVLGFDIGDSKMSDGGRVFEADVRRIYELHTHKLHVPEKVGIARIGDFDDFDYIPVDRGVPEGYMIVDFELTREGQDALDKVAENSGRIILAGTPGIYKEGFKEATYPVLEAMEKPNVKGLALGGDTAAEVRYSGPTSLGGGATLHFLIYGTTEVFEQLKRNKSIFG